MNTIKRRSGSRKINQTVIINLSSQLWYQQQGKENLMKKDQYSRDGDILFDKSSRVEK